MEAINLKSAVQETAHAGAKIIRGEFRMAKGETRKNLQEVSKQSRGLTVAATLGVFSVVFALGALFTGLARVLDGRYWLSGLILFGVTAIAAWVIGSRAWNRIKSLNYRLPITRQSLDEQKTLLPAFVKTFVNRTQQGLSARQLERSHLKLPHVGPDMEMTLGKNEVSEGHREWDQSLRKIEQVVREFISSEKEVEKIVRDGIRGATFVLPVAGVAYLGYWLSQRKS